MARCGNYPLYRACQEHLTQFTRMSLALPVIVTFLLVLVLTFIVLIIMFGDGEHEAT